VLDDERVMRILANARPLVWLSGTVSECLWVSFSALTLLNGRNW